MSDTMTEAKSIPHDDTEKKSLQEDTQTSDDSNKGTGNDSDSHADDDYPDGGLRAWLVAAGAAGIFFCTMGYANTFGVFQAYYMYHQLPEHSADEISWIGSIQTFFMLAMGAVGGPLFDRYGAWVRLISLFPSSPAFFFLSLSP
jgi:hypothetical protein